jgi:iron complex transport system substrate-binding protein
MLVLVAVPGCGDEEAGEGEGASRETRTIEHALGRTEVPVNPRRLVSLDVGEITDILISLDREPVGSVTYGGDPKLPPALKGEFEGIESVGAAGEPNLEKIAALDPDLIVGFDYSVEPVHDELSGIAPTVAVAYEDDWKEWLKEVAAAIGTKKKAEEVLARYRERVESLRPKVQGTRVSVLEVRGEQLLLYGPNSSAGRVLTDLGIEVQPVPDNAEDISAGGNRAYVLVSTEFVPKLTGEHIFLISYSLEDTTPQKLLRGPLWQKLPAVRERRVHPVQGLAWSNHGPIGVDRMIDEVEDALPGPS